MQRLLPFISPAFTASPYLISSSPLLMYLTTPTHHCSLSHQPSLDTHFLNPGYVVQSPLPPPAIILSSSWLISSMIHLGSGNLMSCFLKAYSSLKQQKFISHSCRSWEVQDQGASMVTFWWGPFSWLTASTFSLCPHFHLKLHQNGFYHPYFYQHSLHDYLGIL